MFKFVMVIFVAGNPMGWQPNPEITIVDNLTFTECTELLDNSEFQNKDIYLTDNLGFARVLFSCDKMDNTWDPKERN